ncbi:TetR/AcrR family transcriptional regulator [Nocardia sp. CDC160]|uniref:TetR/AcrR family transcriptional regulator n=1 Tax=Nocardia sp. CDC160 TaxID=3112166 RepID=UPI002DB84C0A|nr:helix-turn-helix domain-containing protein [Nocardia sp. CDC160]MEC3919795.1 helix-turn-helix domain-containing protein [Nocardia sp. CDC160]
MSTADNRTRRRQATKRKVAEAAATLFAERGYAATTLQAIADAAGVHVQTIYQAFGTKVGVLAETAAVLVAGPEEEASTPPPERAWVRELFAEPDPARQLALYAAHMRTVAERYLGLLDIMRVTAAVDPEVSAFLTAAEQGRYDGPRHITPELAAKGALKPGLSPERAADIMYALTTYDVYRSLLVDRGWSGADAERFVAETLATALLSKP